LRGLGRGNPIRRVGDALDRISTEPQNELYAAFGTPIIHIEAVELAIGRGPELRMPLTLNFDWHHRVAVRSDDVAALVVG
jgi:hypothetical protein